jgi:hypothetical protein
MHWITNNNRCVLTDIEKKMITDPNIPLPEDDNWFNRRVLRALGYEVRDVLTLTYCMFTIPWVISLFRYLHYRKYFSQT